MAIIPKPPFPNVPNLPGVPQVPRLPSVTPTTIASISAISLGQFALWKSLFAKPTWAIYKAQTQVKKSDDGLEEVIVSAKRLPVVVPDSFGEFTYRNEWSICEHPVEQGNFNSYNKVANSFEASVRMNKGGSQQARKDFLSSIDAIQGTLDLYDIITPEHVYLSVNVLRYELVRTGARGAYFLTGVELYFREIRETTSVYTTTGVGTQDSKNISAKPVTNTGVVQPQAISLKPTALGSLAP